MNICCCHIPIRNDIRFTIHTAVIQIEKTFGFTDLPQPLYLTHLGNLCETLPLPALPICLCWHSLLNGLNLYKSLDLITSGGVGSLDDITKLKAMKPAGIIVGKALYENKFSLKQALQC